ncbi:MAG: hypothetical protein V2I36_18235 [Desulfopila sp.]|nr:hypothetical protein [Desulfopila sp.]
MQVHPDKAGVSGLSTAKSCEEFQALQVACEILRQYIHSREIIAGKTGERVEVYTKNTIVPGKLPEKKLPFGRFLYRMGIIEWGQLIRALAWQKSGRMKMGELGVRLGYLNKESVIIILKNCSAHGSFGLTARKMGLLSSDEVRELLIRQRNMQKKIGSFFVEKGLLSRTELHELLRQCHEHNRRIEKLSAK